MFWDLDGKTAIVSGGAHGIGEAVAKAFARAGCRVAVLDADLAVAQEVCDSLNHESQEAKAYVCDVSSEKQIESAIGKVLADFNAFDILFNNAGINKRKKLNDWTASDWKDLLDVNFIGPSCVARAVGRHMVERGKSSIVNMAALGGVVIGLGRARRFTQGLRVQLQRCREIWLQSGRRMEFA